ncbi:Chondroitin synthase [Mycovorax composti]|uniref:Chondroitin synthase n=1 Tax=Mycovorax composti TaxID=2962693 RepID=A0ABZ2EH27_9BACT
MATAANQANISLIVSTYNWPEALRLCLMSIRAQSMLPKEVIIADDGSGKATEQLIDEFRKDFPIPLIHVWQEDKGFQLARIRNKAFAKASGDYIVQIDGDLILHKRFIKDHFDFKRENCFVTGSRVIMSPELSERLLKKKDIKVSVLSKGITNVFNGLRIPFLSRLMHGYRQNDIMYVRGCNMAFWKKDLITVNGYDESFVGWGREDNDIAVRLNNAGVQKRTMKYAGVVFHIYHPMKSHADLEKNDYLLRKAVEEGTILSSLGISQYL